MFDFGHRQPRITPEMLVREGASMYLHLASIPINGCLMHMYGVHNEPLDRGSYHLAMTLYSAAKVAEIIHRLDQISGKKT